MRIARFSTGEDPRYAVVEEGSDDLVVLAGDPLHSQLEPTGQRVPLDSARLLAPVIPRSKVIGIGRNYAEHAAELGNEVPPEPIVFLKPNTAVVGPDDPVVPPSYSAQIDYEAELAVVISRICKDVPVERAGDVILGYTAANDLTARDVQKADSTWTRGKAWDSSCPLGPYLVMDLDISNLRIKSWVDDELRQDGSTADMIVGVPELIAYVSGIFTLLPGDVILTGTPAGVGSVEPGQRVRIAIDGIGEFSNPVMGS